MRSLGAATCLLGLLHVGCGSHALERALMATAYRAGPVPEAPAPYRVLAGDMHCHVSPPDAPSDVSRDLTETVELARDEGLDFVVLTPHLPARFFEDDALRAFAAATHAELRRAIAEVSRTRDAPVLIPGFEYTDPHYGHVSASFADLGRVLAELPAAVARAEPARFFEQWTAASGLLVVNHPVVTPLDSIIARARGDMSWRPWTHPVGPFPPEIVAVHRLAVGFEAYNAAVSHLRDGLLVGDESFGVREVMSRLDLEIQSARRRIAPVGGSDSHAGYLRRSVFVLATARDEASIRDAILHGRTCVRSPEACTLEVSAPGGPWVTVGGSVRAARDVLVRVRGGPAIVMRDGAPVARPPPGSVARVEVAPSACTLVRAQVGDGWSAPIYVNCDFADR